MMREHFLATLQELVSAEAMDWPIDQRAKVVQLVCL